MAQGQKAKQDKAVQQPVELDLDRVEPRPNPNDNHDRATLRVGMRGVSYDGTIAPATVTFVLGNMVAVVAVGSGAVSARMVPGMAIALVWAGIGLAALGAVTTTILVLSAGRHGGAGALPPAAR